MPEKPFPLAAAGAGAYPAVFVYASTPTSARTEGWEKHEHALTRLQELVIEGLPVLYSDYVEKHGIRFFDLACGQDLEGIVAKHREGEYGHSWLKIKNPHYTRVIGRSEKFQRKMRA